MVYYIVYLYAPEFRNCSNSRLDELAIPFHEAFPSFDSLTLKLDRIPLHIPLFDSNV